jgi:arylsulfatase A-like enzyme
VSNEIVQHHDWLPTLLAPAGEPNIEDKLLRGHEAAGKHFRVHLDRYNLLPCLTGQEQRSPRQGFIYFSDDGDVVEELLGRLWGDRAGRVGGLRSLARGAAGPDRAP